MGMYLIAAGYWSDPMNYVYIAEVVLALGFVIFVHELGHFLAAKACGVKVEKFYVGFDFYGLKAFSFQYGETEYGLGLIPLGGYVKMLGQDDNPANYAEEMERTKLKKEKAATEGESKTSTNAESSEAEGDDALTAGGVNLVQEPTPEDDEFELDPRSYPARPVWQRMIIISAGVIMNLIFAVIFATFAYMGGVKYTPTIVRATAPGSAAWKADAPLGGQIVAIGQGAPINDHLRFMSDLMEAVIINGTDNELPVTIRNLEGKDEVFQLTPQPQPYGDKSRPSLGVVGPADATVRLLAPGSAIAESEKGFEAGDEITSISTPTLPPIDIDGLEREKRFLEIQKVFAAHAHEPITFGVKRKAEDSQSKEITTTVTAEPVTMKRLGLITKMLPISAIQKNSPAEQAGMKIGDKILKVADADFVDAFLIDELLREHYNKATIEPVDIVVSRDGEPVTLSVTLRQPRYIIFGYQQSMPWFSDALGAAWPISNEIVDVTPDSPAADAGLKKGDKITSVLFYTNEEKDEDHPLHSDEPLEIDDESGDWALAFDLMQSSLPSTKIKLGYDRDDIEKFVDLTPTTSEDFYAQRGIIFEGLSKDFYADGPGEAFVLGLRETKEKMGRIITFMYKLATGQLAVTNLGGPGSIAVVATMEASQGVPRLLLFLTLLSANLAVVNFLPIPVLDGGHFVLLLYEGITGKPPAEKYYMPLMLAGLAFIICLMLFVTTLDIMRFTG